MLSNWLIPSKTTTENSFFTSTFSCQGNFPDLSAAKVVVFSVDDEFSEKVRESISKLHNHFSVEIVDIGILSVENISTIYQVISELQDGIILPVFLGVTKDDFWNLCQSMDKEQKINYATFVSNTICLSANNYDINNIGFQRHYISKENYIEIATSSNAHLSLGSLRQQKELIEPLMRDSNYIHFDLAAIRKSDCPNIKKALPTGITSEEACQLMRYAGESMRCKLITIDTQSSNKNSETEAMLVAEMIWYMIEGHEAKPSEHPAISDNFNKYIVEMSNMDFSLEFFQSTNSGKWWFRSHQNEKMYVSCSLKEYESARQDEIPDRILNYL